MKRAALLCLCGMGWLAAARADLTIVERTEGMPGSNRDITVKIRGDMARIDLNPQMATIVDGRTGEVITLMMDQKKVVRISATKMKAAAEMVKRFSDKNESAVDSRPRPTGRKDTVNGYEVEEYTVDTPLYKAAYWVAPGFPEGASILKQLQAVRSDVWKTASTNTPDYRDFPALPIKTVVDMKGTKITTTLVSVRQDPLSETDFAIPRDFEELKVPDLGKIFSSRKDDATGKGSPHP
jgi:hypothetical protein